MCKYPDVEPACVLQEDVSGRIGFVAGDTPRKINQYRWDKLDLTYAIIVKSKDAGIFSKQRRGIALCLTTWGAHTPLKFHRVKKTQNPDIRFYFVDSLTVKSIAGIPQDILEYAQARLKKSPKILAFAWYPKTSKQGVVVFNDVNYNWDVKDHYKKFIHYHNFIAVGLHELGHTVGEEHSVDTTQPNVMDAIYHNQVTLSHYDISGVQSTYGPRIIRPSKLKRLIKFLTLRKKNL